MRICPLPSTCLLISWAEHQYQYQHQRHLYSYLHPCPYQQQYHHGYHNHHHYYLYTTQVCGWLRQTLGDTRVREVRVTHRLSGSPAIITDHESGALRRMMAMVDQSNAGKAAMDLPPQVLEVNPKHPIIRGLAAARVSGKAPEVATLVADQVRTHHTSLITILLCLG